MRCRNCGLLDCDCRVGTFDRVFRLGDLAPVDAEPIEELLAMLPRPTPWQHRAPRRQTQNGDLSYPARRPTT